MSTTSGNMESFKVTDKNGNVYIMTPVDTEARQAIDEAKNLQFDDDYFTSEVSQDETTVNIGLNGVPLGVDTDTPLKFVQDTVSGVVIGSDAPFSTAIAPEYDSTATYEVDESVIYKGNLYIANQDISAAEDWTPAHWTDAKAAPFVAEYDVTSYQKVLDAYNAGRTIMARIRTGNDPITMLLHQYHPSLGKFDFSRCYYNSNNNHYMIGDCQLTSADVWSREDAIQIPDKDDYLEQYAAAYLYDSEHTGGYPVGYYVTFKGKIYRCKTAIPAGTPAGTFDLSKWEVVQIMHLIGDIETALAAI